MAQNQMKSLAKDTAIYGLSSIVSKFLNYLLVPFYTYVALENEAEYGVVTELYAWTALLLVILTYGMETGLFRFLNKEEENPNTVYRTTLVSVGTTSLFFSILIIIFSPQIAVALKYPAHPEYVTMLGLSVALDAFACIPFAYLRYRKMPLRFAALKILYVALNISCNLFFYVACPFLMKHVPQTVSWFYNAEYGVGYVFVSNIISTTLQTLFLIPYIRQKTKNERQKIEFFQFSIFNFQLLKRMLAYSLPLLLLGIMGILDQTFDKISYKFLRDAAVAETELGIYGAASKIALIMLVFTQAFRYAYEPFVFGKNKEKDSTKSYAEAMKYFVIFSWLIFLGMMFYMDFLQFFVESKFRVGLQVVPIILIALIFQGVYFNLSIWYKLTDKTMYGAVFSSIGTFVIFLGNVIFVPQFGYYACAWAAFVCYFLIMLISYFVGQKHFPIAYDFKTIGLYSALALVLWGISWLIETSYQWLNLSLKTILFLLFAAVIVKRDFPLQMLFRVKR